MSEEVYPLAVLIDELRHEDATTRVNAMGRVSTIALAMGPARTRNELIPFLEEAAQEDEDEVLVVLADELAKFVPLVGGSEHAQSLIGVLSALASCEEPTVRLAAVASLSEVIDAMSPDQAKEYVGPLVKRIATTDWFSSRMSATGLFALLIRKSGANADLLALYKQLVTDEAPMVRRAAATHLPAVVEALDSDALEGPVEEMFDALVHDDQDSVRLLAIPVVISIAKVLKAHNKPVPGALVDATMDLLHDSSWRVRYMAADRIEQLAKELDSDALRAQFVTQFVSLCKDAEAEVRTAVAKHVVGFCELQSQQVLLEQIVPVLEPLVEDPSEHVREALATQVSRLSPMLGKDNTIEFLLPLFLQMLKDEHSEVRLQIISNLQVINEVIGIDLLSRSLLPAISQLAKDKQWRVLLAIIEYSPLLAQQLGVDFFNKELMPLVMQWLWDPVWAVRDAAAANLVQLCDVFGSDWLEEIIVPKLVVANPTANYLYRLTALQAVKTIIPVLSPKVLLDEVLPFILSFSEDPVPNIRFNCAKAFQLLAERLVSQNSPEGQQAITDTVLPFLEKHSEDVDVDVRSYVDDALKAINAAQSA